ISWWGGASQSESDKFFNAINLANISKFIISQNHSVYYLSDKYNSKYIPSLEDEGLQFIQIPEFSGLYRVNIIH
ncbi:MAG: hypothetical protein Q8L27_01190, partial [archaeon]|nr:hypothetical protein [archaeon]